MENKFSVMKKSSRLLFVALLGLAITSCSSKSENTTTDANEVKTEVCTYSYDNTSSKVEFSAYKFLRKAAVGGVFNDLNVTGGEASEDAAKVIKSLSFEIPISGIDTKDAGRDQKVSTLFFGTINTNEITGKVVKLDAAKGEATLSITMNGISNDVVGKYTLEDANFSFNAEINVNDWKAEKGIEVLNKECKELHTDVANGDKVSKLWPDVSIAFTTTLKKECK